MVDVEELDHRDEDVVEELISNHVEYTDSQRGAEILENWATEKSKFVKVIPPKYKQVLAESREENSNG
jgi:glutamate synthase (NADPH/NADH) large chain